MNDIHEIIRKKYHEYIKETGRIPKYLILGHKAYNKLVKSVNTIFHAEQTLSSVETFMDMKIALLREFDKSNKIEVAY